MQVRELANPSKDEFSRILESCQPSFVYLQGEQHENDEIGSLVWNGVELSLEDLCGLFNTAQPTTVCSVSLLYFDELVLCITILFFLLPIHSSVMGLEE